MEPDRILLVPLGSVEPVNKLSEKDTMIRMREALRMWNEGRQDYLLVTGGAFTSKKIMTVPGARVMKKWFIANGVSSSQIIVEDESRDTYQNVEFSLEIIKSPLDFTLDSIKITVVTQWQHAIRFWLTFRAYGIRVNLEKLHYPMGIVGIAREYILIAITALDPKGRIIGALKQRLFRQNR